MTSPNPQQTRLRVAHLNPRTPTPFALQPDADTRAAIAAELGISELPKLEFSGQIRAESGEGWALTGRLVAKVVQPCVVTLKPVRTNLNEVVERHYSPHLAQPDGEEVEMQDETLEPLGQFIDLSAAMVEELALALPEYPRADGAAFEAQAEADEPADTRRPFAGLDKLLKGGGQDQ